ncbi:deleted in autism protein 1 homolog isoform X2 [Cimex lectularius]|nr:deleted in autism protein 1 homolog isoform X2 [Cimex lectularius]
MLGRGKITLRGHMDGKNVFVKKMADPEEFSKLHKKAENLLGDPKVSVDMLIDKIDKSVRQIDQKLILCPQETEVRDLLGEIRKTQDFKQLISIWTSLEVNPEAAMLQMLQPPMWPVPKYYGACGSLIVVEDCGDMLSDYYDKSYNQRARISAKLLRMAMMFTFRHAKYAFYFTDFSPDNIAVDSNENVCLVDLEHIYVVDKYPKDTSHYPNWNITYSASHYNCQDCFLFRPSEICSHHLSDQNILSVCREILFTSSVIFKEGFLYDSPADIFWLIYDCVNVSPGETRFKIAEQLITTLEKY